MPCFGLSSKRKTKRVTVPNCLEPVSLGVPVCTRPQQQVERARADHSGQHALCCHMFRYDELQLATSCFSSLNLVGEGGFGRVYQGRLADGTLVAVKRLDRHGLQGDLEFNVEVSIMAGLDHPNVVPLLGSCCEADHRIAVFDYMPHGNLRDLLDSKIPAARHFNWPARLNVLLGVAKGLEYLHHAASPAIVHRDLKSSNILIDAGGQARICDFGLARHKSLPQSSRCAVPHPADSVMMGTFGYMAPEYAASGQITDKSDMYAFGVVVLEMMSGMQAVDARRPQGCETLPHLLQPALQAVQLMQGNLDPALKRHAPLPAAQLAALCEVAASCLEPRPQDRPSASVVVTYLQKVLKSTDAAAASAAADHHARTVSSPPTGPSYRPTPRNLSFYDQQFAQQQRHPQPQQRHHRPAHSMPHLTCTPGGAEEDMADSAHSPLSRGHELRSSAGYGGELGIFGPSRHLTPLTQGLRSASLCSLPAAAAAETSIEAARVNDHPAAAETHAAAAESTTHWNPPTTQEVFPSDWGSVSSSAPSSPVATDYTLYHDGDSGVSVRQVGTGLDPAPIGHQRGQACGPEGWRGAGVGRRDLRDSAWGSVAAPLQPPSAPPLCRSSSAQAPDPMNPRHHASRRANGHRPTQSTLPAYHQTPCSQQHVPSSSQQDQSLQQLVQSRTAQEPVGSPSYLGGSPQLLHPHHEAMPTPGKQQQPGSPKMTKRQSGNPFAYDYAAGGGGSGMGQPALSRGVSGNPFAAKREMNLKSSSQSLAGHLPDVDSNVNDMRCFGSGMMGTTAADCNIQQTLQSQASPSGASLSANSAASAHVQKNPEMSPLQNGLIRAWPSPCKVQPPEVTAGSWHHFLSASARLEAAGPAYKDQPGTAHHSPASGTTGAMRARVGVCLVCLDAIRDWQMVPCGHAAACKSCAQQLRQHQLPCPVCRAPVTGLCYRQFQQTFVGSVPSSDDCKQQRQQAF